MQLTNNKIDQTYQQIKPHIIKTPLVKAITLSEIFNANIYLKLENIQTTHSFKIRGAMSKLLSLNEATRKRGIVTASSGNHGAAVAYGCQQLNIPVTVYVGNHTSEAKLSAMRQYKANIEFFGEDCGESEQQARKIANEKGLIYISPYNDIDVVRGQASIGVELADQLDKIDQVYVATGGGGLIAGIGTYLKAVSPNTEMVCCLAENSPCMQACLQAGEVVQIDCTDTIADGIAGNLEPGSITIDLCKNIIDDTICCDEAETKAAMKLLIEKEHLLIEGSAGTALAAMIKNQANIQGKNIVLIVCGANISLDKLKSVI